MSHFARGASRPPRVPAAQDPRRGDVAGLLDLTATDLRAMEREAQRRRRKAARRTHNTPLWKRGASTKAIAAAVNHAGDADFYRRLAERLEATDRTRNQGFQSAPPASVGHALTLEEINAAHQAAAAAAREALN